MTSSPSTYDRIARFYDVDMAQNMRFDDVAFYAHECARQRGRVVEVGCGNGRILLPLMREGHDAYGIDASAQMLRELARKASALRLPMRAVQADARCLAQGQAFALDLHRAGVQRGGNAGHGASGQALGHRQHHEAAVGLGQQAALGHRTAGLQGGGQVQATEQAVVGDGDGAGCGLVLRPSVDTVPSSFSSPQPASNKDGKDTLAPSIALWRRNVRRVE